jgi:peptidoglycan/xylan/chitin deacetylase (PgdA/CDA1 family)
VLDRLDEAGIKATFFLIGERAARHPALAREIVRRGHAVENHAIVMTAFASTELAACGATSSAQCDRGRRRGRAGVLPRAVRDPQPLLDPTRALRSPPRFVDASRFDTVARDPARVLGRIARGIAAGDILLLHDGIAARARTSAAPAIEVLPVLGARLAEAGLRSVTLRIACAGDDGA